MRFWFAFLAAWLLFLSGETCLCDGAPLTLRDADLPAAALSDAHLNSELAMDQCFCFCGIHYLVAPPFEYFVSTAPSQPFLAGPLPIPDGGLRIIFTPPRIRA